MSEDYHSEGVGNHFTGTKNSVAIKQDFHTLNNNQLKRFQFTIVP